MNHQIPQYNQSVPNLINTDWASMAKQWATLRANVNIPASINKVENYTYHNIPPPPPPPPCLSVPKPNPVSYSDYKPMINNLDSRIPFNRNTQNLHVGNMNNNVYEPPTHSIYDEILPSNSNSQCETFDYNHRDRPFVNFNNITAYNRPSSSSSSFSQNIFNLPPPTHQDYVETPQIKSPAFLQDPPLKLFPIDVKSQSVISNSVMPLKMEQSLPFVGSKFDNPADFSINRSNKGLPAWIIDDMKKIKEKERKQPVASMDDYRDHLVNSKRDEEGDIVMEDVNKESEIDPILSGKSVITTNRIDNLTTDIDIDDVNLNDEDDGFDKIDYSSKSLIDLIEMLDESELDTLKIIIIRDSLTGVMKEVTDDMITEVVNSTFSIELSKINIKPKVKGVSRDSKTVNCISDATVKAIDPPMMEFQDEPTSYLLGLDVYESDDEIVENLESKPEGIDKNPVITETRDKWSTHKRSTEAKIEKNSSRNKDNQKSESKEKKKSSSDTNSNRTSPSRIKQKSKSRDHSRKRSKSRERHRSPDHRHKSRSKDKNGLSHKKSKKHNHSPDWRDNKWKNDKCESSNSSRKRSKRDRSRS